MFVKIQPFGEPATAISYLNQLLNFENGFYYLICSAFVRESGVRLIEEQLSRIPVENIKVLAGGRNGVTSYQAIELLRSKGISVTVVDTGDTNRIFHPKLYVAYNNLCSKILLGSSNLTHSGLCNNIESLMYCELDLGVPADFDVFNNSTNPILTLHEHFPDNCFIPQNESQTLELLNDGILVDENVYEPTRLVRNSRVRPRQERRIPRINLPYIPSAKARRISQTVIENQNEDELLNDTGLTLIWSKQNLSRRDLQIPQGNTNPSGTLSLTQSGHSIDHTTFFRDIAFFNENWRRNNSNGKDEAIIGIALVINGVRETIDYNVLLSHKPEFEADQRNYTTSIHWGANLKSYIANERFLGSELFLYRRRTGFYEIHLTD